MMTFSITSNRTILASLIIPFQLATSASYRIQIEDFTQTPTMNWSVRTDSLIGGNSTGSFRNNKDGALLEGNLFPLPNSRGPGFFFMWAQKNESIGDISHCDGIEIHARSNTDHKNFSFNFASKGAPELRHHKASFKMKESRTFIQKKISFAEFDDVWRKPSGDVVLECMDTNIIYCPTIRTLKEIERFSIFAEGNSGKVILQVRKIFAYNCEEKRKNNLFTSLANMLGGENSTEGVEKHISAKGVEEDKMTQIESKVSIPIAGFALFISLVALCGAWRTHSKGVNGQVAEPKVQLESKPGDEML